MLSLFQTVLLLTNLILFVFATPEQLGVKHHKIEGAQIEDRKQRNYWNSRLTFPNTKDVFKDVLNSDRGQLAQLAKDAYIAMTKTEEWIAKYRRHDVPDVMAALAVENKIYFLSSVKGGGFLYVHEEWDSPLKVAMTLCEKEFFAGPTTEDAERRHRTQGACAEILALWAYLKDTQNKGQGLEGSRIVAVRNGNRENFADPDGIEVYPACGLDQDPDLPENRNNPDFLPAFIGCHQVMKKMGVDSYSLNQFRPYKIGKIQGKQAKDDPILFDVGYPTPFC